MGQDLDGLEKGLWKSKRDYFQGRPQVWHERQLGFGKVNVIRSVMRCPELALFVLSCELGNRLFANRG